MGAVMIRHDLLQMSWQMSGELYYHLHGIYISSLLHWKRTHFLSEPVSKTESRIEINHNPLMRSASRLWRQRVIIKLEVLSLLQSPRSTHTHVIPEARFRKMEWNKSWKNDGPTEYHPTIPLPKCLSLVLFIFSAYSLAGAGGKDLPAWHKHALTSFTNTRCPHTILITGQEILAGFFLFFS